MLGLRKEPVMKRSTQVWLLLSVFAIIGGFGLVGLSLADDKDAKGAKDKSKPNVVEVDLSKLPPDVAKQVLESLKKKEDVKPISLVEAIGIAEKAGKGQATKAERKGEGSETQFQVDVVGKDGEKTRISLSAAGKVVESGEPERKGPPPGKGK